MTCAKERCEDAAAVAGLSEVDNVFKLPQQAGLACRVLAILTHMVLCGFLCLFCLGGAGGWLFFFNL